MGTVTYPNPDVARCIRSHFVAVQLNVVEQPEMMDRFVSSWTPTVIVQDDEEREYRRSLGYLDPHRFVGDIALARLAQSIHGRDYKTAHERALEAIHRTKGDPWREPEALYFGAVADYKASNDAGKLTEGWHRLMSQFPNSDWAKKAEFIKT
jgi:hypothetical protein